MDKITALKVRANRLRQDVIEMTAEAGSGHPGGSLSSADIMSCLYFDVLRHNPKDPKWPDRDRFVLSKGHACPVLYSALARAGYFPVKELKTLRKIGSRLQGHPDNRRTPGVEICSGSLGQGISAAVGMALAGKMDGKDFRVYAIIGDGEMEEGEVWEAAMSASHYKLDNLCVILDYNGLQIDGPIRKVMSPEPIKEKWLSFGWHAIEIDGNNISEILNAFKQARKVGGRPTIIIAHTIKGKGVSFMENVVAFHGKAPTKEEAEKALEELKEEVKQWNN